MFIGTKEILKETVLDENLVQIEFLTENDETETTIYHKDVLSEVKTDEPNKDETSLRFKRSALPINDIVLVLLKYNVRGDDINHIFQSVGQSIDLARESYETKELYGDKTHERTLHHYSKELINN